MALSFGARGLLEGLVAATPESGELVLHPTLGLEGLVGVLGRPWDETKPLLQEVLESGKFVYDAERNVLIDQTAVESREASGTPELGAGRERPCHAPLDSPGAELAPGHRQSVPELTFAPVALLEELVTVARAMLERASPEPELTSATKEKPLSTSAAAIRSRKWRRERKLAASANANACPPRSSAEIAVDPVPPEQCSFAFAERSRTSPLSDLKIKNTKTRGERVVLVRANDDGSANITPMPPGWLEHATELRPDLPTSTIHDTWSLFVAATRTKNASFPSWAVVQIRWEAWLRRELAPKAKTIGPKPKGPKPSDDELAARRAAAEEQRRVESMTIAERIAVAQQAQRGLAQMFARAS